MKLLVGGGSLTARGLFADIENFSPTHTFFFLTNTRPRLLVPNDYAFWQRYIELPFRVSFVDKPHPSQPNERLKDKDILEKMKGEGPGILAKVIHGLREWQAKGLLIPESILTATEDYRNSEDIIKRFFDDCCIVGDDREVGVKRLYDAYVTWCDSSGRDHIKLGTFSRAVGKRFKRSGRRAGGYFFEGLDLATTT
jgi:putative DNA primase/helicase